MCPPPGPVGGRVTGWWIGSRNQAVLLWWVPEVRAGVGEGEGGGGEGVARAVRCGGGVRCGGRCGGRVSKPPRSVGGGPSISHPPRQRGAGPPTHPPAPHHPLPPSPTHHTSTAARDPDPVCGLHGVRCAVWTVGRAAPSRAVRPTVVVCGMRRAITSAHQHHYPMCAVQSQRGACYLVAACRGECEFALVRRPKAYLALLCFGRYPWTSVVQPSPPLVAQSLRMQCLALGKPAAILYLDSHRETTH